MTTWQTVRPTAARRFGCEQFGRLTRVLLHRPSESLKLVRTDNCKQWLFDFAPDPAAFCEEHDRYRELLAGHGVETLELADHVRDNVELMHRLPNLTYMHDTAVISRHGAILSRMAMPGRRREEVVVREALGRLGVPLFDEFTEPGDAFEGCLLLSPETLLVAATERHSETTIRRFIPRALAAFDEVIYVDIPKARRFMHPDTIYNRIDCHLAMAYLPAFRSSWLFTRDGGRPVRFAELMSQRGIELICVSDSEQARLACSFVPLEPGVIFHYDTALDRATLRELARRGVELILFHPRAMVAGGGSLRCLTLRMHRQS